MSGWVAMHRSEEADALQERHPNAFLLLAQIARRARWRDCHITGLKAGEALVGDWKKAGIPSEMAYRVAKKVLLETGLATFRGTTRGTVASLAGSSIFSISDNENNERSNDQTTDRKRTDNDRTTTNVQGDKETPITKKQRSPNRRKKPALSDEEFLESLKSNPDFAGIPIDLELEKAASWCRKNNRTLTREFITRTWLPKAKPLTLSPPTNKPRPSDENIGGRTGTFEFIES